MPPVDRQRRALLAIQEHVSAFGRAPSVRELAASLGYSSPRSAAVLIEALLAAGKLRRRKGGGLLVRPDDGSESVGTTTTSVPILGAAPCGVPLWADENLEGHIRVDVGLAAPPHRYFVLRATGDSMNSAGIEDGDLVLVRSTPLATDGDRVVALVDGEVTIKVLRRRREVAALEPSSSNPSHRPIFAASSLEIQGVVVVALS